MQATNPREMWHFGTAKEDRCTECCGKNIVDHIDANSKVLMLRSLAFVHFKIVSLLLLKLHAISIDVLALKR